MRTPHHVYILASRPSGALYVGSTSDLDARVSHHRAGLSMHTARYGIDRLVWHETHEDQASARARERAIKRWRRTWKNALIAERNPDWEDLAPGFAGGPGSSPGSRARSPMSRPMS